MHALTFALPFPLGAFHFSPSPLMSESVKTVPISGRIAEEDYQFLIDCPIPGKVTPSEKLRHLAAEFRERRQATLAYESCLELYQELLGPAFRRIRALEHETGMHSEVMEKTLAVLPDLMAVLTTFPTDADAVKQEAAAGEDARAAALLELEARTLRRLVDLLEALLRLAMTRKSPTYDAKLLNDKLDTVIELSSLIGKMGGQGSD